MIENYKKIRLKRRLRRLRLVVSALFKNTVVLTCVAGFIAVSVPLFSAYEAHIINVTARIENDEKKRCDALSIGYWQNHEGCPEASDWTLKIRELSDELSKAFINISATDICFYLAPSNCGPGGTIDGKLCRAKGKALANLSNIVSNHLDLNALIAGADDGNKAFGNLELDSNSTVKEALTVIESIIIDSDATKKELTDAAYVAERIYTFYEEENPNSPWCIYPETNGSAALNFSPSVSGAMTVEPPVEEIPPEEPQVEDPPAEDPVPEKPKKEKSPAEDPDPENPPAEEEPPVKEEPATEPLTDEVPADEPVEEEPPAEEPQEEEPVEEDPPAEDPPAEDPPAEELPAEEPPVEEPVPEDPPAEDPPTEEPPVEDPPVEEPVPEDPPVEEEPPVEEPPAEEPPAEEPAE